MTDAWQRIDPAAERAEGLTRRCLCRGVRAPADHGLFLFISVNDAGCQAVLCCQRPNDEFLRERLVSQAGRLVSDPADESVWRDFLVRTCSANASALRVGPSYMTEMRYLAFLEQSAYPVGLRELTLSPLQCALQMDFRQST